MSEKRSNDDVREKKRVSRRDFLKLSLKFVEALELGRLVIPDTGLRGYLVKNLTKAITDPEFRKRLIDTIKQGRLKDKLALEVQERRRPYSEICGLGEPLNLKENVLDNGFENYEVRPFITNGEQSNNLILLGKLKKNIRIYERVSEPNYHECLKQTMEAQGEFITIPSPYTSLNFSHMKDGMFENMIDTYSAYSTRRGIVEYAQDKIEESYGALILTQDGAVKAVDKNEVLKYMVGWNCDALQSYGISICSDSLDTDLASLDRTEYNDGRNAAISRNQSCLIVTFSNSMTHAEETMVMSLYQHYDANNMAYTGDRWELGLSMEQSASICEQIALEKQYDRFVILGPDPTHAHSSLNGPGDLGNTSYLRKYSFNDNIFFDEASVERNSEAPSYEAPIFLGVSLG